MSDVGLTWDNYHPEVFWSAAGELGLCGEMWGGGDRGD